MFDKRYITLVRIHFCSNRFVKFEYISEGVRLWLFGLVLLEILLANLVNFSLIIYVIVSRDSHLYSTLF